MLIFFMLLIINTQYLQHNNNTQPKYPQIDDIKLSNLKYNLPLQFDWRNYNIITSVKNQGNICAACWAFVANSMIQSYLILKTNRQYHFSEQFLIECTQGSNCTGGYISDAIKLFKRFHGLPTQQLMPYSQSYNFENNMCNFVSSVNLDIPDPIVFYNLTEIQLKKLLKNQPLGIAIYISEQFVKYKDGIISCKQKQKVNHAVLLIGWDQSGNYIIKNQYGVNWGMDGYGIIDRINNCSIGSEIFYLSGNYRLFFNLLIIWLLINQF